VGREELCVVVLGMPKTATTALHEAFVAMGLPSVHWALFSDGSASDTALRTRGKGAEERLVSRQIRRALEEGLSPLERLPPGTRAVAQMDSLVWRSRRRDAVLGDFPQMDYEGVVRPLLQRYPGAKFILNMREVQGWIRSLGAHNDMRERMIKADLPGLPSGSGQEDEELTVWVERHWAETQRLFEREKATERLLLLPIDQGHARAKDLLEAFLQRPVRWEVANASERNHWARTWASAG